jgi:hypothetical protein
MRSWRYPALILENIEIKDVKLTVEKFQPDLLVSRVKSRLIKTLTNFVVLRLNVDTRAKFRNSNNRSLSSPRN